MKRYIHSIELESNKVNIEGMARVGELAMRGSDYEIYVNTDDSGKIPHFHVRDKKEWDRFHTCVRIDKAEYFLHENKNDTFNTREKKLLEQFMNSYPKKEIYKKDGSRINNWEYICMLWDANNSDVELSSHVSQPNYTEL